MKTAIRLIIIALLFAACISSESLSADFAGPAEDGWHTWRVQADDGSELEIFVSMLSGRAVELQVRGDSICADKIDVNATDLGVIGIDESIDWLRHYIEPRSELSSDAIMAISLHSGDRPVEVLASVIEFGTNRGIRKEALFWLVQSDSDAAFEVFDRLLSANN